MGNLRNELPPDAFNTTVKEWNGGDEVLADNGQGRSRTSARSRQPPQLHVDGGPRPLDGNRAQPRHVRCRRTRCIWKSQRLQVNRHGGQLQAHPARASEEIGPDRACLEWVDENAIRPATQHRFVNV